MLSADATSRKRRGGKDERRDEAETETETEQRKTGRVPSNEREMREPELAREEL